MQEELPGQAAAPHHSAGRSPRCHQLPEVKIVTDGWEEQENASVPPEELSFEVSKPV